MEKRIVKQALSTCEALTTSYLGAYWGGRPESAQACGERLARCVDLLGDADPVLQSWFRKGARKADAGTPVDHDPERLTQLLLSGQNRRDFGGEVIEELGFSVGLWNRARPEVGLTVRAAGTTHLGNNVVLQLPPMEEGRELYQPATAHAILAAIIGPWEPEWATWTTHPWRAAQSAEPGGPVVGWLTYVRDASAISLSSGTNEEAYGGRLISAAPTFPEVSEAQVLRVRQELFPAEER